MRIQKKILLILILLFIYINLKAKQFYTETTSDSLNYSVSSPSFINLNDSVIHYGKLFLNTPYRYGSSGSNSFDCSGFTSYVYRNFGYNLERSSSDQAKQFPLIKRNQIKTGDLVFFEGRRRNGRVGHVGIVVTTNDSGHFDFIHAAVHSGVIISNSREPYYVSRYVKAGRIIGSDTTARIRGINPTMRRDEYVSLEPANSVNITIPAKYHKVKKGENLSIIAQKYGLTVAALKQRNNLKNNKLKINQRLKIKAAENYTKAETILTNNKSTATQIVPENEGQSIALHNVKKDETLNSIEKNHNIPVSEITNLNDSNISNNKDLKISGTIKTDTENNFQQFESEIAENKIKQGKKETISENKNQKLNHIIKRGESLYTIAQLHNISVEELKLLNHLPDSKIKPGQILLLSQKDSKFKEEIKSQTKNHKVKSGESFYSIAKTYGCTVAELKALNGRMDNNLSIGDILKVYDKN